MDLLNALGVWRGDAGCLHNPYRQNGYAPVTKTGKHATTPLKKPLT
jgi:hypothetical protein